MLAPPGGLYLDVKSAYSTAQQLKWFASTLAGIGVNVKVRRVQNNIKWQYPVMITYVASRDINVRRAFAASVLLRSTSPSSTTQCPLAAIARRTLT